MRMIRTGRALAFVAAAALLAACGDSTAPATRELTVDSLLADVSAIESYSDIGSAMTGVPLAPVTRTDAASCVFTASTQSFVCAPVTTRGVQVTRSYQLLDASGAPQSAFNAASTAAIRTISDVSGTTSSPPGTTPPFAVSFISHSDQTLSGLLTTTRALNGTGTSSSTITSQGTSTTFASTQKIENLVLPSRGSASPYPASGKITVETTAPNLFGAGSQTVTIVMTYNGTSIMTMSITSGGSTTTCTVDLSTPRAGPSCSGG